MDIIAQTLEFMAASKNRKYVASSLNIKVEIKQDDYGFIIDPIDTTFKCGWGSSISDAVKHCAQRNNIEL